MSPTTPTPAADRADICRRTAAVLRSADPAGVRAVLGFDGFVDNLMSVVDRRLDAEHFEPVRTIDAVGRRITAAAGHSSNIELVLKQQKLGGNGPIMANALAVLGLGVTYVGNVGHPAVHPVFNDFARRATVYGVAEPGVTDALEFDDGKLMLNKNETLADVTWANVVARVGLPTLVAACDAATLIGMANWTMLPHLTDVWRRLLGEVMPKLSTDRRRHIYVDLADPAKRTEDDLSDALTLLTAFQKYADVVLGLNANEAKRVARLLGLGETEDTRQTARAVRDKLGLAAIVVHTRQGAAGASYTDTAAIDGPFVRRPVITTGAGDHFNAGCALGLSLGLKLDECLCCGVAVGGYYVSRAASPTLGQLADFVAELPEPEDEGGVSDGPSPLRPIDYQVPTADEPAAVCPHCNGPTVRGELGRQTAGRFYPTFIGSVFVVNAGVRTTAFACQTCGIVTLVIEHHEQPRLHRLARPSKFAFYCGMLVGHMTRPFARRRRR